METPSVVRPRNRGAVTMRKPTASKSAKEGTQYARGSGLAASRVPQTRLLAQLEQYPQRNINRQRRSVEEDEQQWQQVTGKGFMLQTSSHVSSLPSFLCGGQLLKRNYANAGAG
ncbi:hypothetical protein CCHR01_09661 [Colletotrichum chrysophilum]|uniref:Uncharacterized protein n=1 Tax=Colletotrichum chrysophilum TaxID=1836956 RepID=A0AAD9AGK0_9PEZI|nr:hypothetical protein CCHR01_09661 [Colletotrichum chrysophilum]